MITTKRSLLGCLSIVTALTVCAATLRITNADTFRPVVHGRRGVVAGGQPLSVEAGTRILQNGGNAGDARGGTNLAAPGVEVSPFFFGGEVAMPIKIQVPEG